MNTNNISKHGKVVLSLSAIALISFGAQASLYVSPVTKDSASLNYENNVVAYNNHNNKPLTATGQLFSDVSQVHSTQQLQSLQRGSKTGSTPNVGLTMSVTGEKPSILIQKGTDLPLHMVMENIVPMGDGWKVNYGPNLQSKYVSWNGGDTWEGVITVLADQNGLHTEINHSERVVGIAKSSNIALHLAKKIPTVWRLEKTTLRENLLTWTKQAGWGLEWDDTGGAIDFKISHEAIFTGELIGKGGVIDKLLGSLEKSEYNDTPLSAKFYKKNTVVEIKRGGYEQDVSFD